MRKWLLIGLGLTIAWVATLALLLPKGDGPGPAGPPTLEPPTGPARTSFAWPLRDLDDKAVNFDQFRGRPVFLNLWATWCGPCLEEMPSIARLAADPKVRAAGVAIVCVSADQSPEALRRYVAGKAWPMTVLRATALPAEFMTDGIPATFLIAPDGRIVARHVGAARWDDPSVVAALRDLAGVKD